MNMSRYISSAVVTFAPKSNYSSESYVTTVLLLDIVVGATVFHVFEYIRKNPLVKSYLNKYNIINLTFQYSEL